MLLMSRIIKDSILEFSDIEEIGEGEDEQATRDAVHELANDMTNGVLDTVDFEFLAWSPKKDMAIVAIDIVDLVDILS